jgi:hypothetical protein
MQNRRERRKLLKQFGLLKSNQKGSIPNIEEGKEIHRRNLQEMRNSQIKSQMQQKPDSVEEHEFFMYRQNSPEYGSFQSMLLNKDWDQIEKD